MSGLRALKVGGRLVYTTTSLSVAENDGVIDRVLARVGPGAVEVRHPPHNFFEM